jgi:hypothetical protein
MFQNLGAFARRKPLGNSQIICEYIKLIQAVNSVAIALILAYIFTFKNNSYLLLKTKTT